MEKETEKEFQLIYSGVGARKGAKDVVVSKNYECNLDIAKCPSTLLVDGFLYYRIDSLQVALEISKDSIYSVYNNEGLQLYQDDYYDAENDEYISDEDVSRYRYYSELAHCFNTIGCVYIIIIEDGDYVGKYENNIMVRFLDDKHLIAPKGSEVFTAKYSCGTNAFYYKDNMNTLVASRIDEIVIHKRTGCNSSVDYKMQNGTTVSENNVILKDKALEWVNNKG